MAINENYLHISKNTKYFDCISQRIFVGNDPYWHFPGTSKDVTVDFKTQLYKVWIVATFSSV